MKILLMLPLLGTLFSSSESFMDFLQFENTIVKDCYGIGQDAGFREERINGQIRPLPNSIETFVSLIQRLEEPPYNMGPKLLIENILVNFRYDDVQNIDNIFETKDTFPDISTVHEILHELFNGAPANTLPNDVFTNDERCALYFMVSHTINETESSYVDEYDNPHPLEQGVVNLNGKSGHAFALGKVLLGILAGLQPNEVVKADEIYSRKSRKVVMREELKNVEISLLHSATISDIIYLSWKKLQNLKTAQEDFLFPNGIWNDAVCPTHYILNSKVNGYSSFAHIRGAVDGMHLGKVMRELKSTGIRLSQVLRSYYSPSKDVNWCARHAVFKEQYAAIVEASSQYSMLISALSDKTLSIVTIKENIEKVMNRIDSLSQNIFEESKNEDGESCITYDSSRNKRCETSRDILAILDLKASEENREIQYQIIGNLSVGFYMNPTEASMGVYTNQKPSGGGFRLDTIVSNSNISGCQSCAALHAERRSASFDSETEVIRNLNHTLQLLSEPQSPGVPAKVVLYFNYGSPREEDKIDSSISKLRAEHRGIKIFAIGNNRDPLKPFVENIDNDIFFKNDIALTIKSLKERVCQVPAELQYENCYIKGYTKSDDDIFRGFITPSHKQHLFMNPKYFLKSFSIKMWFNTLSGRIRVCYSRNFDAILDTSNSKADCKDAEGERAATFKLSNPCKKRDVYNCDPFYFSIEAQNEPTEKCSDKRCKTQKQIVYQFQHEGISCNGAIFISCSTLTMSVMLLATFIFAYKNFQ